jgi:hypothetical protein
VLPDAKKNARNVFDRKLRKLETKRHAGKEGRKKKKLATAFICITKENKNLPSIPS